MTSRFRGLDPAAAFPIIETHRFECIFFFDESGFHPNQPVLVFAKIRFAEEHSVVAALDVNNRRAGTRVHGAPVAAEQASDVLPAQESETVTATDRASGSLRLGNRVEQGVAKFCSYRFIFLFNQRILRSSAAG
jgi:hypothetical protein